MNDSESESVSDDKIKQNIRTHLASKLSDLTLKFKNNEKEHYTKLKDLHGEDAYESK